MLRGHEGPVAVVKGTMPENHVPTKPGLRKAYGLLIRHALLDEARKQHLSES